MAGGGTGRHGAAGGGTGRQRGGTGRQRGGTGWTAGATHGHQWRPFRTERRRRFAAHSCWVLCGNGTISLGHGADPLRPRWVAIIPAAIMFCQEATWTRDAQVSRWIAQVPAGLQHSPALLKTALARWLFGRPQPSECFDCERSEQSKQCHVQTIPDGRRTWESSERTFAQKNPPYT